jgi:hypothetical protein
VLTHRLPRSETIGFCTKPAWGLVPSGLCLPSWSVGNAARLKYCGTGRLRAAHPDLITICASCRNGWRPRLNRTSTTAAHTQRQLRMFAHDPIGPPMPQSGVRGRFGRAHPARVRSVRGRGEPLSTRPARPGPASATSASPFDARHCPLAVRLAMQDDGTPSMLGSGKSPARPSRGSNDVVRG